MTFLIFANILFLFLGCLLDATTIILVIIPLFIPTCRILGIDLVHFGVVAVVNCMIGLITPPYGMLLFVINGATGIPIRSIVREVLPYIAVLVFVLVFLIFIPGLTLWLPRQFGYEG
jgi:TRAP-type C4-dicarboxylate transport system permease large subunit